MSPSDIVHHRLINQQIAITTFTKPGEIVHWMIAMQAQEYAMAKWAIGLRLPASHDADVENAFNNGDILRTHLMRPTWHFVAPPDIRWLLALTAPRVNASNSFMYRKLELDNAIFKKTNRIIANELEGGKQLTRTQLQNALMQKKIHANGPRLGYIMMRAELDAIICSGARLGKQFTYALLEERVPLVKPLKRDEALAAFTTRYFRSRGPATVHDFAYWSGLTIKDASIGIAGLASEFIPEKINGKTYIFVQSSLQKKAKLQSTFLMPDYDEYGMSYKDRSALLGPNFDTGKRTDYSHWVVINGKISGTWKPTIIKNNVLAETLVFGSLNIIKHQLVKKAVKRYTAFKK